MKIRYVPPTSLTKNKKPVRGYALFFVLCSRVQHAGHTVYMHAGPLALIGLGLTLPNKGEHAFFAFSYHNLFYTLTKSAVQFAC